MAKEDKKTKKSNAGLAIPAGIFIGMGIGFLFDNIPAGLFLGLGCGFLVLLIALSLGK